MKCQPHTLHLIVAIGSQLACFLCVACIRGEDDELVNERVPYEGAEIRIDGYWYTLYPDGQTIGYLYFLYEDGTLLSAGDNYSVNEDYEANFTSDAWVSESKKIKYLWGVFLVDGNEILYERLFPATGPDYAYVRGGVILDEETFHMTSLMRSNGEKKEDINEMYFFKEFSPKPDHSNPFIQ